MQVLGLGEDVWKASPDPPQAGGVKVKPENSTQRPMRNARGSAPTQRNLDLDLGGPNKEIGSSRTTPKDWKDPKKSEKGSLL